MPNGRSKRLGTESMRAEGAVRGLSSIFVKAALPLILCGVVVGGVILAVRSERQALPQSTAPVALTARTVSPSLSPSSSTPPGRSVHRCPSQGLRNRTVPRWADSRRDRG